MKAFCLALLALAVLSVSAYDLDEGVIVGTDSNFDDVLKEFQHVLVEFYAPWCGHCKSLAPEYAKAAQDLAESHPGVKLVKVDATAQTAVAGRFEIGGYPTIKFFVQGHPGAIEYNGGRTSVEIVNWLKRKTGNISTELTSLQDLQKAINNDDALVLYIGSSNSGFFANYISVATGIDDASFYHTESSEIKSEYGAKDDNVIVWANKGEQIKVYSQAFNVEDVTVFVNKNKIPTVVPFTQSAAQKIFGGGLDAIFLIISNDDAGRVAEQQFRAVAPEIKEHLVVSLAKIEEDFGGKLAEFLGVSAGDLPVIRLVKPGQDMKKFSFQGEINGENIKSFINDYKNDNLKPHFKSEEIPHPSHEGNVRILVGKNFQDVVVNSNDDVLVEFYAPWCGHCKTLAPIYEQLATHLKDVEGIVIAKMDATANEVEGVNIEGFPTIKFYPKGQKSNPVVYEQGRDLEGFLNYLRTASSAKIPEGTPEQVHSQNDHAGHNHDDHAGHDHEAHGHSHDDHTHHDHSHQENTQSSGQSNVDGFEAEDSVIIGTDSNFDQVLEKYQHVLVEFYAPWCGHCKTLAPEYAKAATVLAESNPNVKLVKVDATAHTAVAGRFEIGGYPTIKFFNRGGATIDFNGGRTAGEIVNWLTRKTGDLSAEVASLHDLQKAVANFEAVALFIGSPASSHFAKYLTVASGIDDVNFFHTESGDIKSEYGASEDNVIVWNNNGESHKVYTHGFDVEKVNEFIDNNKLPLVIPFTQNAAQKIFGGGMDAIFLIVADNEAGRAATEAFRAAAPELKNHVAVSIAKIEDDIGGKLARFLGVEDDHLPIVRLVKPSENMLKYGFDGAITVESLRKFIGEFAAGSLAPYFKSEEIPNPSHEGNVRILVGKNFKDVVLDSNEDVLVEFYAPWCGHCKTLVPIYEQLATQLKDVEGIVIAKMDATANEAEGVHVEGFPTIKFYPKGKKSNPVDYDQQRELEDFLTYLRQHSSAKIPAGGSNSQQSHDHSHSHEGHNHGHDHGHNHGNDHHGHNHDNEHHSEGARAQGDL